MIARSRVSSNEKRYVQVEQQAFKLGVVDVLLELFRGVDGGARVVRLHRVVAA